MKPVLTAAVYALGVGSLGQPDGRRAMIAPSGEQIEIAVGDQQAVVVEVGGGLRSYSAGSRELVDGYRADEMSSSGRGQVLIPWPNRLQDGRYEFDGRCHQLPLNEPEHRTPPPLFFGLPRTAWKRQSKWRERGGSQVGTRSQLHIDIRTAKKAAACCCRERMICIS